MVATREGGTSERRPGERVGGLRKRRPAFPSVPTVCPLVTPFRRKEHEARGRRNPPTFKLWPRGLGSAAGPGLARTLPAWRRPGARVSSSAAHSLFGGRGRGGAGADARPAASSVRLPAGASGSSSVRRRERPPPAVAAGGAGGARSGPSCVAGRRGRLRVAPSYRQTSSGGLVKFSEKSQTCLRSQRSPVAEQRQEPRVLIYGCLFAGQHFQSLLLNVWS